VSKKVGKWFHVAVKAILDSFENIMEEYIAQKRLKGIDEVHLKHVQVEQYDRFCSICIITYTYLYFYLYDAMLLSLLEHI